MVSFAQSFLSRSLNTHTHTTLISSSFMCGMLGLEQDSADGRAPFYRSKVRLNVDPILHFLGCLHEVNKGMLGLLLSLRNVEIMPHYQPFFRKVMEA